MKALFLPLATRFPTLPLALPPQSSMLLRIFLHHSTLTNLTMLSGTCLAVVGMSPLYTAPRPRASPS